MTIKDKFKKFFASVENVFAKEYECISCGREIVDGTAFQLCEKCMAKIELIEGKTCAKCGDKLSDNGSLVCDHCKDFDYAFTKNFSCCYYDDVSATIIKNLKYNGRKYIAKHIAELLEKQTDAFENIDIITFVPISKKRERMRGFNQSEEIAKFLGEFKNIPVRNLLIKKYEGKHQAKLSQADRLKNLIGSFDACDSEDIKNKNILIIDDVFTTGTTLSECAKTLLNGKPKSVSTLTFAKTRYIAENF